jgi:hypothetical protein
MGAAPRDVIGPWIEFPRRRTPGAMPTAKPLFPIAVVLGLGGCFSPERITNPEGNPNGGKADDPANMACAELDEPCATNGDCCDFSESPEAGTALCVDGGAQALCFEVCSASSDCGSGCCGRLDGITEYGACMGAAACPDFEFGGFSVEHCLAGVEVFCTCGDQLGVPCDDQASFEQSCRDGPSSVTAIFDCFAGYSTDQCGAGIDACG